MNTEDLLYLTPRDEREFSTLAGGRPEYLRDEALIPALVLSLQLCDVGKVIPPLCAPVPSSVRWDSFMWFRSAGLW